MQVYVYIIVITSYNFAPADGHKIAQRLSKQISRQTKHVKKALDDYNRASAVLNQDSEDILFSAVIAPDSSFWNSTYSRSLTSFSTIPAGDRHDLIHSYLLFERSTEELDLLKNDIDNFSRYYSNRKLMLQEKVQELQELTDHDTAYKRGSICLLKQCIAQEEQQVSMANKFFLEIGSKTDQAVVEDHIDFQELEDDDFSDSDSDFDD